MKQPADVYDLHVLQKETLEPASEDAKHSLPPNENVR